MRTTDTETCPSVSNSRERKGSLGGQPKTQLVAPDFPQQYSVPTKNGVLSKIHRTFVNQGLYYLAKPSLKNTRYKELWTEKKSAKNFPRSPSRELLWDEPTKNSVEKPHWVYLMQKAKRNTEVWCQWRMDALTKQKGYANKNWEMR